MRGILIAIVTCTVGYLIAAPQNQRRYENEDMRNVIYTMQHELGNNQHEIKVFDERLGTLDASLDAIRLELQGLKAQSKDKLRTLDIEGRLGNLDLMAKGLTADIKTFKTQLNETTTALGQFKARFSSLEKIIESQNQNIDALQAAMRMLTESTPAKEGAKATKTYTVKSGDALEKIARANQMSIEEIKELNGLTTAKIIVGQKLLIYDK